MRILIIGGGGREHALAWKLAQEHTVYACPGNPGISQVAECIVGDPLSTAIQLRPDLVVVGPENPLIEGLADRMRVEGLTVFGPGTDGAQHEASKAFSKTLMQEAGVPTAPFSIHTDAASARMAAKARFDAGQSVAVKPSGAALGKGVVVCDTYEEADEAIAMMLEDGDLGEAGETVVIEDRLRGWEFSLLSVVSGTEFVSLPVAQDYKRALDGDRGPNTGGMGTYSPVAKVDEELVQKAEDRIVRPMLQAMKEHGIDYRGVLFSGVMVVEGEPMCLEYNVRFGDPETQTVMRRLGSGLGELLYAAATGQPLPSVSVDVPAAVTVVLASSGYPGAYAKGIPVSIPGDLDESVVVFHAGTAPMRRDEPTDALSRRGEGEFVSAGGRVLGVSATGATVAEARAKAYAAAERIEFEGKMLRRDIAAEQ
ncbi:MAG: phosphoribosylamine--glycine ligase [Methanoregulaceae archaeon]|nr:phosphoribosylamine--glycine ligase [Methanoregulaceae archaeon]